jgi:Flp pilus assembly secretin CpaC
MNRTHLSFYWLFLGRIALGSPVVLPVSASRSFQIPHLKTVSIADSKIARARAMPPSTLILTGLRPGQTTVRAFNEKGQEAVFELTVLASAVYEPFAGHDPLVVKIALEFLELDLSMVKNVGVRWPEAIQGSALGNLQPSTSGINYTASFTTAKGMLQFLVKEGWAKLLANPDLYVRMGEEAVFHSGGELPISASTENYGRMHRSIQWKPFGLTVKVRPQSGDGVHIGSDIKVEISEVNRGSQIEGIPALINRNLETKMNPIDGETVILSGLIRQVTSQQKEKVPLLSGLPLLGFLFGSTSEGKEETEVFMAITFSLVNRSREKESADQFRERFESKEWQ